ncbi:MAG: hypothetical protein HWD59_00695 [Coxiellaceae bacterium]|nr:MAG: hypothetical protein HWD59_00695 [Coxiellaceae bacterium]
MTKLCEVAKNSFEAQGRHVGMKMAQVLLGHLESKLSTDNSVEVPTLS